MSELAQFEFGPDLHVITLHSKMYERMSLGSCNEITLYRLEIQTPNPRHKFDNYYLY